MWDRGKIFLRKMGKIILIGSVIVWALSSFPRNISFSTDYTTEMNTVIETYDTQKKSASDDAAKRLEEEKQAALTALAKNRQSEQAEKSYIARLGKTVAPIFAPLGVDWRGGVALLTGFVAKEIVVSTLGILHATGNEEDPDALEKALLASGMTPLSALSMMVFVLLYMPCLATTAAIKRETSYKWMFFSIAYSTSIAWIMAFFVYQGGKLLGFS